MSDQPTEILNSSGEGYLTWPQPFMTVEQMQAQIASLTAENERLREVMRRLKEDTREHYEYWIGYGCDGNDAIRFVGEVSNILRAALQPEEDK